MQCPKCGVDVTGGAESCPACGEAIPDPSSAQKNVAPPAAGFAATRQPVAYAGFWLRALAYLLDSFLLGFVLGAVFRPILSNNQVGSSLQDLWKFYMSGTRQATAFVLLIQLANWLYFASFESSPWQATPGKKLLSLKVADLAGKRLSFARASGRYFGKILSWFTLFVGFAMAGFTQKKQALHDMMAGCLVLKKT